MKQGRPAGAREPALDLPAEQWGKRLRARYPEQTAAFEEGELDAMVRAALAACPVLQISEPRDVFRTIALRVLVTPEQKRSKLTEGSLLRIMCNLEWSAKKRLDFVYKHIIGRAVAEEELDLGPSFIPRRTPE